VLFQDTADQKEGPHFTPPNGCFC